MTETLTLTSKDRGVIVNLINFFYEQGGVRNRTMVADLDNLLAKMVDKPELKTPEKSDATK
jgi:hypothetical protein